MIEGRNIGHGWVRPRPDGYRARCGGPGICAHCSMDAAIRDRPTGNDVALKVEAAAVLPERRVPVSAWALAILCNALSEHDCRRSGPCSTCMAVLAGREALKP